jgi:endonuclease-3
LGLPDLPPPDWAAVEAAPIPELTDVIRPGGLANQKAPRIQAALRALIANGGSYSLEFLAGKSPLEARDWLSAIPGIGKKTASVVLLFSFGTPLMPVDRHVHRVSGRIGLIPAAVDADAAHDYYLAMLTTEQMYETHVSLISHGRRTCHARNPDCEHCPVAPRCRYFDSKAE